MDAPTYTYSQVDCLFYPFLSGAYSFSSPLAGGSVHCAAAGVRLPVFLLPEKLEGEGKWEERYNKTLGSSTYKEKVKPIIG